MKALVSRIDPHKLTQIVGEMLQRSVTLLNWSIDSAHSGYTHGLTGGIYRLAGQADDGATHIGWSLILKIVVAPPMLNDVADPHYWKRELLAYQSSLLPKMHGVVRAPHCYLAEEVSETSYWLWLEEAEDVLGHDWPLAHYQIAAHHLGEFNGRSLTQSRLPKEAWLSRNWLQAWLADYTDLPKLIDNSETWHHPLTKNVLLFESRERLLGLWRRREPLFKVLSNLPQGLCHMDAYQPNLVAQSNHTILLDWDKMGIGAVGEELGGMVQPA